MPHLNTILLFAAAIVAAVAGCGPAPVAQAKKPRVKAVAAPPPKVRSEPLVTRDAFPSVAAAMDEVEQYATSANPEDQRRLVRVEQWLTLQGGRALDELAAIAGDESAPLASRLTACRVLPRFGPVAAPALTQAAGSSETRVRARALQSLGKIEPTSGQIVATLSAAMTDSEPPAIRAASIQGLGSIGPAAKQHNDQLASTLVALLNDTAQDETVRSAVHAALKQIEPRRALVE